METSNEQHKRSISRPNRDSVSSLIFNPQPTSALYISPKSRWEKDFAAYNKQERALERNKRQENYNQRRINQMIRENKKMNEMEDTLLRESKRIERRKEETINSHINARGMGINPITLEYYHTLKGNELRDKENKRAIRGLVRAKNLEAQNGIGYNILNGKVGSNVIVTDDILDKYNDHLVVPKRFYRIFNDYRKN